MAKTRSKVKSSDEDGSPKSAQKKVKLLQSYVVSVIFLWWLFSYVEFLFKVGLIYQFSFEIHFLIFFLSFFSEENSTVLLAILEMCTHLMSWTCQWTPMNPLTACAIRSLMAR